MAAFTKILVGARDLDPVLLCCIFRFFRKNVIYFNLTDCCLDEEFNGLYKLLVFESIKISPLHPIKDLNKFHKL